MDLPWEALNFLETQRSHGVESTLNLEIGFMGFDICKG